MSLKKQAEHVSSLQIQRFPARKQQTNYTFWPCAGKSPKNYTFWFLCWKTTPLGLPGGRGQGAVLKEGFSPECINTTAEIAIDKENNQTKSPDFFGNSWGGAVLKEGHREYCLLKKRAEHVSSLQIQRFPIRKQQKNYTFWPCAGKSKKNYTFWSLCRKTTPLGLLGGRGQGAVLKEGFFTRMHKYCRGNSNRQRKQSN